MPDPDWEESELVCKGDYPDGRGADGYTTLTLCPRTYPSRFDTAARVRQLHCLFLLIPSVHPPPATNYDCGLKSDDIARPRLKPSGVALEVTARRGGELTNASSHCHPRDNSLLHCCLLFVLIGRRNRIWAHRQAPTATGPLRIMFPGLSVEGMGEDMPSGDIKALGSPEQTKKRQAPGPTPCRIH